MTNYPQHKKEAPVVPQVTLPAKKAGRAAKPRVKAILPAEPQEPAQNGETGAYELMERRDDEQILAELQGRFLDEYVYEINQDGHAVTGLSWIGTKEASREYGGIQVPLEKLKIVEENEKSITLAVEARDVFTGTSRIGVKRQQKMLRRRDGSVMENPFYFEQAVSKAQRNAINAVIPYTFVKAWIQLKRKGSSPQEREQAQAQIQQIREEAMTQKKIEIAGMLKKLGHSPANVQQYQKVVLDLTQLNLAPENYDEITNRLSIIVAERGNGR